MKNILAMALVGASLFSVQAMEVAQPVQGKVAVGVVATQDAEDEAMGAALATVDLEAAEAARIERLEALVQAQASRAEALYDRVCAAVIARNKDVAQDCYDQVCTCAEEARELADVAGTDTARDSAAEAEGYRDNAYDAYEPISEEYDLSNDSDY